MDSRPLLNDADTIGILIDSETFADELNKKNPLVKAILSHNDPRFSKPYPTKNLELFFIRTPIDSDYEELNNILKYNLIKDDEGKIRSVDVEWEGGGSFSHFYYKIEDIEKASKKIFNKTAVNDAEKRIVEPIFVQASYCSIKANEKVTRIFVTENKPFLKNRLWLEWHLLGTPINLMDCSEAANFLDLFFKQKNKYYVRGGYIFNKGFWYWISMRSKIPHYNVGDSLIDAMAYRLQYCLMALDEIGIQHFSGVSNDTLDDALYHFNYLITLITGIFDNLALQTNEALELNFTDYRKVSISNSSGKEFLIAIRDSRQDIRSHINSNVSFINLIYLLRELVVHREGLGKTTAEINQVDTSWKSCLIKISDEIEECLRHLHDRNRENDPFTEWGFCQFGTDKFIVPFYFAKNSIINLIQFIDQYLVLLGYPSFIEDEKKKQTRFARYVSIFESGNLGF